MYNGIIRDWIQTHPVEIALTIFTFLTLLLFQIRWRSNLPLPPGPRGFPFIGNVNDFPDDESWVYFDQLAKKYGDITNFTLFGQRIMLLNNADVVSDLLDKKSLIYSDKMNQTMLTELMGFSDIMVIMPYGEWWRKNRKYFHRYFNIEITQTYKNIQLDKARQILPCIASSPENIVRLMRRVAVSTIVKTTFGFDIKDMNDSYVVIAEKVAKGFSQAGLWGSFYVDIITWLKYIPEWFPGAYFKRFAAEHKALLGRMRMEPFVKVQKAIENGTAKTSICASMIGQLPDEFGPTRNEEVELAVNTTTIAYAAGADTTTATLQWLILALLLNPEVQTKAHEELDRVVGHSRLPDFDDLSNLPYIQATVKETLRWHPTVPLIDHSTTEDDEYKGHFIPKGTVVIANIWGLLHDPDTYPDPLKFKPERFLTPDGQLDLNVKDPSFAAFGFGRRICPGRFFAINTLNIIVASLLHVYTMSPETDANGQVIPVKEEVESSAICPPKPFHCKAQARSAALEALVNQVEGVEE